MSRPYILVINPGSTSTKVAVYEDKNLLHESKINHSGEEIGQFSKVSEQYNYRLELIYKWLDEINISTSSLRAVVGRGGLLRSIPGGTYVVTEGMIKDLEIGIQGEHASNLGGILAKGIGDKEGIKAFIVDPVSVDEFDDIARISGLNGIERRSLVHALNIKAVSHKRAKELDKDLKDLNLIVAHLGGGISIAPIRRGKIIDVNNAGEMGPFSPDRAGSLPVGDLVKLCYSGKYTHEEMRKKLRGHGGLMSYLGTVDGIEVVERIKQGDKKAKLIYEAMAYQIGKDIGGMATVLKGKVDNIILTGGLAHSESLVKIIDDMTSFIAKVIVYPGESEMDALNFGALRVLKGIEKEKIYEEEVLS